MINPRNKIIFTNIILSIAFCLCISKLGFTQTRPFVDCTGDCILDDIANIYVVTDNRWIDDGDLTINPNVRVQIDPNSSLTFEQNHHIDKSGARIIISATGQIIKGTAGGGCTSVTCYTDADSDGYGAGSAQIFCNACPAGFTSIPGDCCDSDFTTHPDNNQFVSWPTGCGGYDHDCDGEETKDEYSCNNCIVCETSGEACASACSAPSCITYDCTQNLSCGQHYDKYICDYRTYIWDCSAEQWINGVVAGLAETRCFCDQTTNDGGIKSVSFRLYIPDYQCLC
jgi:hypothetical protein